MKRLRKHGDALAVALLVVVLIGGSYWKNAQTQAAQQRQGELIEHRLCLSLEKLAALKPPAGNPATNPSRAFDQAQHAILAGLGPDIRCPR